MIARGLKPTSTRPLISKTGTAVPPRDVAAANGAALPLLLWVVHRHLRLKKPRMRSTSERRSSSATASSAPAPSSRERASPRRRSSSLAASASTSASLAWITAAKASLSITWQVQSPRATTVAVRASPVINDISPK